MASTQQYDELEFVTTRKRHGFCRRRRCSINLRCQCLAQGILWSILIIEVQYYYTRQLTATLDSSGRSLSLKEEWTPRLTRQFIMGWFQSSRETNERRLLSPPIYIVDTGHTGQITDPRRFFPAQPMWFRSFIPQFDVDEWFVEWIPTAIHGFWGNFILRVESNRNQFKH